MMIQLAYVINTCVIDRTNVMAKLNGFMNINFVSLITMTSL